jgi:hypothetical protein
MQSVEHRRISTEYRTTAKLEFIAIILIASMAGFAAYAQDGWWLRRSGT